MEIERALVEDILKKNIQGAFVECGVDTGRQEVMWISKFKEYNTLRHIHMYDTFKGLTKPTEFDYMCKDYNGSDYMKDEFLGKNLTTYWEQKIIDNTTNAWCYTPLDKVKYNIECTNYNADYLHYVVGDVMETLSCSSNIPDKIAYLRLDTDWYDSTKKELDELFNNVVENGIIVFDDYFLWNGQRKAVDDFLKNNNLNYKIHQICNEIGYIIKSV